MNAMPAITVETYECACQRQAIVPVDGGLPTGWARKPVTGPNGLQMALLCPDCDSFEKQRASDLQRKHDSSSAINDEPAPPREMPPVAWTKPAVARERSWQITVTFHTDKGIVETAATVKASNPLAAIDELEVQWGRISEMFALTVIPAPLEVN